MPTDPTIKETIKAQEAARKSSKKNQSYVEELDHILVQQEDKKVLRLTPQPESYWELLHMTGLRSELTAQGSLEKLQKRERAHAPSYPT